MAGEEQTTKSQSELEDRVWELAKSIQIAVLTSWDGESLHMRPMSSTVRKDEARIYFLADVNGPQMAEIAKFPKVAVGYFDTHSNKYVTIDGTAAIENNRSMIEELWSPFAKAWWDSAKDPSIRLIVFSPRQAEFWDSPHRLVAGAIMLGAALTGGKPAVGDHAKVVL